MSWWEEEIASKQAGADYAGEKKKKKRKGIFASALEFLHLKQPSEDEDEDEDGGINQYSFPENYEFQRKRYKKYQDFLEERRQRGGGMSYPSMEEKSFKVVDK